jgi:hypothetical protein
MSTNDAATGKTWNPSWRTVRSRLHAEVLPRDLAQRPLGRFERDVEPLGQQLGRERLALGMRDAHQLGQRLRIPPVHGPPAKDGGGHARDAERLDVAPPLGLGPDV